MKNIENIETTDDFQFEIEEWAKIKPEHLIIFDMDKPSEGASILDKIKPEDISFGFLKDGEFIELQ